MAGASLWATRLSGKLNGEMAATTPTGTRRVKASRPSPISAPSIGTISPVSRRASTAANVKVLTARVASTRAVLIGLAASWAMVRANSSRRSSRSRAARSRISARRQGERLVAQGDDGGGHGPFDVCRAQSGHPTDLPAVVRRPDDDGVAHDPNGRRGRAPSRAATSRAWAMHEAMPRPR